MQIGAAPSVQFAPNMILRGCLLALVGACVACGSTSDAIFDSSDGGGDAGIEASAVDASDGGVDATSDAGADAIADAPPDVHHDPACVGDGGAAPCTTASGCGVADQQGYPFAAAVDCTSVYWVDRGTFAKSYTDGKVMKCPLAGCGAGNADAVTLAEGQAAPVALAVDAVNVYWTNLTVGGLNTGTVMACAIGGCNGKPTTLATGQWGPTSIAVDATSVYWSNEGNMPNGGGGTIMKCPIDGCGAGNAGAVTLASGRTMPSGVAVDAANVYWADAWNPGTVSRVAKAGGAVTPIASNLFYPRFVAVDAQNVYWVNQGDGSSANASVEKCAVAGCASPTTVASAQTFASGLAIDDTNAYWANANGGTIVKCALGGCGAAPTTLASGIQSPWSVAIDRGAIYFTQGGNSTPTDGAGTVRRALK
jgi:hypothetical protein